MAAVKVETMRGGERPPVFPVAPRFHPSPLELFAAAVALVIPIAYASGLEAEAWSARTAILLLVSAIGLPILVSQSRARRAVAARSAVAFLVIGATSAVLSPNHTTAIFGLYNQGTGLLFMVSLAAAWAIGCSLRPQARPLIEVALIAGVLVNVGIALLGSIVDLPSVSAGLVDVGGRSSALTGNPVHLGALAVLGLALFVPRFASAPATWAFPVAATAAAVQLSGTRVALVVLAALVVWAGRRHGVRIGIAFALLVIFGLAAGGVIGSSSSVSATARANGASENWRVRPQTWLSARHALARRPLLGIGPGQFRTATSPYRPDSVGRLEGPDQLLTDAHNLLVEYATTTGLLGVGALAIWLLAAIRPAQGSLLVVALAVLAIGLVEPQSVVTTPLAFLALGAGASYAVVPPRRDRHAYQWIIPTCCVVVAISAAAMFLVGEFDLRQAQLDLTLAPARQANAVLPLWPRPAALLARIWLLTAIVGRNQADYRLSRSWQLVALKRDDSDPSLWNDLADTDASRGLTSDASVEYLSALHFNPTSARAMDGLARLARGQCDPAQEWYWTQRSRRVFTPSSTPLAAGVGALQPRPPVCAGK